MVFRDRDMTNGWTGAADSTLEQRHYYAQNWRADVSVIVDNAGVIQEWDKYRAYGVPFLLTVGDHTKDGVVGKDDEDSFGADYAVGNLRADLNKDGSVTSADQAIFNASYSAAVAGGRWKLSAPSLANRKGFAGYEHDGDVPELAHVRNRVLHFGLGRWTRRDPLGYVDGVSTLEYVASQSVVQVDPSGLVICPFRTCTAWTPVGPSYWGNSRHVEHRNTCPSPTVTGPCCECRYVPCQDFTRTCSCIIPSLFPTILTWSQSETSCFFDSPAFPALVTCSIYVPVTIVPGTGTNCDSICDATVPGNPSAGCPAPGPGPTTPVQIPGGQPQGPPIPIIRVVSSLDVKLVTVGIVINGESGCKRAGGCGIAQQ